MFLNTSKVKQKDSVGHSQIQDGRSMEATKKRKTMTEQHADMQWPAKPIPSFDATLQTYPWPYGSDELLKERSIVRQILEIGHSIRMPNLKWTGLLCLHTPPGIGLLGMPISVEEAFIDSDGKRNMLVDRAHEHFNTSWKLEVLALIKKITDGCDETTRQRQHFLLYERTEEHLYATVDNIDKLRSLFDRLKPETIALVFRCNTTNEIRRAMVYPTTAYCFLTI